MIIEIDIKTDEATITKQKDDELLIEQMLAALYEKKKQTKTA